MSTIETDLYWANQESVYQDFCSLVDGTLYEAGRHALDHMKHIVAPETYKKCEEYLTSKTIVMSDPDEDEETYKAERENQYIESHLYPSEGFNPL